MKKPNTHNLLLSLALCIGAGTILYWLVWDIRPYPIPGWVDDYLYVRSAWYIKQLKWLGPFDAFTLVKRPFFPLLLAATSALHVPFIQFQMLFYLGAVIFFTYCLCSLGLPRWIAPLLVTVLGFVPTLYDSNGSRILRETPTVALELLILGLTFRLLRLRHLEHPSDFFRGKTGVELVVLYGLVAFHWGMREEGILLTGVLIAALQLIALRSGQKLISKRIFCGLTLSTGVIVAVLLPYLAIAGMNVGTYGVFLVNDLSEGTFPKAVAALRSIREGTRPELLLEPAETDKLRAMSPTFQRIGDVLHVAQSHDPNMDYSHEMFFLRVSALRGTEVGTSATKTQEYFETVSGDVIALCKEGKLVCDPNPGRSMIPRLNLKHWDLFRTLVEELTRDVLKTANSGFDYKSESTHDMERPSAEIVQHFTEISRQQPFGLDGQKVEYTLPSRLEVVLKQQEHRRWLGALYSSWSPALYAVAAACLPFLCFFAAIQKNCRQWIIVIAILGLHVVLRIFAFSYVGAAFDGTIPVRLMTSAYPFALACGVLIPTLTLHLLIRYFLGRRSAET